MGNGLSAGAYPVCPGTPGIFDCQVRLTEEGLKNYKEIVKVFFQYISLLRETPPQEWIFEEQKGMADVDFKFKQKTPASRFTRKISSVMQKPLPREWLLSGQSKLRKFDVKLLEKAIAYLTPDNFRLNIISRTYPGDWNQTEKWYGTEYRVEKLSMEFMKELEKAATVSSADRLAALHLPHKNNFIPTKLEVEKKEIKEPALAPKVVRNDGLARTWWKKDDTFWVPKANLIVSCKHPLVYGSVENSVKARLFTDLVRDALEEYSYDAELAGLQYSVSLDSRGLFLDLSGYNDKLPVLLEQVLKTVRDLEIKDDRFDIIKERLKRGYSNWELQQPINQISDYGTWLNSEKDYIVEEAAVELPSITAEGTRQFKKLLLAQMHIEVYVHGNIYKRRAEAHGHGGIDPQTRALPPAQWPIIRSLILPPGSNYVYKRTLKDPANVNHCMESWFYVGDKGDKMVRAKTLLLDQLAHEPAFDQLRTKEQLGYSVYSGVRGFSTTYGFRFIIQSEKTPEYLDERAEAFLVYLYGLMEKMTDAEFEGHKRSVIVRRLEKVKNLDQESSRHWGQISSEYYDFELAQQDAAHVKGLSKADMLEFFNTYISASSPARAKIAVYLYAQSCAETKEKVTELLKGLDLDSETALKVQDTLIQHEKRKDLSALKAYLVDDLKLSGSKASAVIDAAKTLEQPRTNGTAEGGANGAVALKEPVLITDVRAFRASLVASSGVKPVKDMSEYEEIDSKL